MTLQVNRCGVGVNGTILSRYCASRLAFNDRRCRKQPDEVNLSNTEEGNKYKVQGAVQGAGCST